MIGSATHAGSQVSTPMTTTPMPSAVTIRSRSVLATLHLGSGQAEAALAPGVMLEARSRSASPKSGHSVSQK